MRLRLWQVFAVVTVVAVGGPARAQKPPAAPASEARPGKEWLADYGARFRAVDPRAIRSVGGRSFPAEVVQEAVQDVGLAWVTTVENGGKDHFDEPMIRAYFERALSRKAMELVRDRAREPPSLSLTDDTAALAELGADQPRIGVEESRNVSYLLHQVEKLVTAAQYQALTLHLQGYESKEIAAAVSATGTPVDAQQVRQWLARDIPRRVRKGARRQALTDEPTSLPPHAPVLADDPLPPREAAHVDSTLPATEADGAFEPLRPRELMVELASALLPPRITLGSRTLTLPTSFREGSAAGLRDFRPALAMPAIVLPASPVVPRVGPGVGGPATLLFVGAGAVVAGTLRRRRR